MSTDDPTQLSDESTQALEEAAWDYIRKVKEIISQHTDEELTKFAGKKELHDSFNHDAYCRRTARTEVMFRQSFKKAKPILDKPGSSGWYCVWHDCDGNDCKDLHPDE